MVYILGMGEAYPDTVIDNDLLFKLFTSKAERDLILASGVETRHTVLTHDYILETRNKDPRKAFEISRHGPTELALKAAELALHEAGIKPEELSLVIGDGSTPRETTPSEAQRVAGKLGLKIAAYDLTAPGVPLAAHLDSLLSWKTDRIPEYILLLSTSTLTTVTDYRDPALATLMGDGAYAMVISPRRASHAKIIHAEYGCNLALESSASIDIYGYIKINLPDFEKLTVQKSLAMIESLTSRYNLNFERDRYIGQQFSGSLLKKISADLQISKSSSLENVTQRGYMAGSSAGTVLAENWRNIKAGEKIVSTMVGFGSSWGNIVVEGV